MENRQQNKYEISDAQPEVLEHFAGQKRVKALVQTINGGAKLSHLAGG
jgi:hypothetical protein